MIRRRELLAGVSVLLAGPASAHVRGIGRLRAKPSSAAAISPTYQVDLTAQTSLPANFSLTRASTATYFDVSGVMQTAAIDTARFDHAIGTSTARGLLIEAQATNEARSSQDLTNGTNWTFISTSNTLGQADPAGGTTAGLIAATGAGAEFFETNSHVSGSYISSLYLRRTVGSGDLFFFKPDGSNIESSPSVVGSTWVRGQSTPATTGSGYTGVLMNVSGDALDVAFAQREIGTFPTSYITTTSGAGATRSADVLGSNAPLTGLLAAGPSVWEFMDEATGVISRTAYAAGAFDWPTAKWYRSMAVYPAGTDTSGKLTPGTSY
jgi:hypothetical protein